MAIRLFKQHVHPLMPALAAIELVAAALAVVLVARLRLADSFAGTFAAEEGLALKALLVASFVVLAMTSMGLYQSRQRLGRVGIAARVTISIGIAAIGLSMCYFVFPIVGLGRGIVGGALLVCGLLFSMFRFTVVKRYGEQVMKRRVLFFGAGERASMVKRFRRRTDQIGFKLVGFVRTDGDDIKIPDDEILGTTEDLAALVKSHRVDEVIMAMDDRRAGFPVKELLDCKFSGVQVLDIVSFLERETGTVLLDIVNPSWFIFSDGFSRQNWRVFNSRVFDLLIVGLMSVVAIPIILLAGIATLLTDGLPIFYVQERVGLNGRPFRLYKLRSMKVDAEKGGAAVWASKDDDRVTLVGKFIRKVRIDELPQLWNVVKGDMSIVGPRPERPEFVEGLAEKLPYYHERHMVRPGLTGWAQMNYPYSSTEEDALKKLQYDIYYVKNHNLLLDIMILLQTAEVVIWSKGAR